MLLLIDGTNVVMRYASAMVTKEERAAPALDLAAKVIDGTRRAIFDCAKEVKATHLIVALDSSVGSWRRDRYPEYKAHRTADTAVWSNLLHMSLVASGIFTVRAPGFEADDVIATLASRASRTGKMVAVLSSDSDLLQLASLNVHCYQFGGDGEFRFEHRTLAWIKGKYEIESVGHLPAYKALVGEPGDHLPGVPGIGKVKARKLLAQMPLVDLRSYPYIDQPQFTLMLDLVTLRTDVPIPLIDPGLCRLASPVGCGAC